MVPFAHWGLDIVGPFLLTSRGRKFIFIMIDNSTKWVEGEAIEHHQVPNLQHHMLIQSPITNSTNNNYLMELFPIHTIHKIIKGLRSY